MADRPRKDLQEANMMIDMAYIVGARVAIFFDRNPRPAPPGNCQSTAVERQDKRCGSSSLHWCLPTELTIFV